MTRFTITSYVMNYTSSQKPGPFLYDYGRGKLLACLGSNRLPVQWSTYYF
jgi:hypothetical protein